LKVDRCFDKVNENSSQAPPERQLQKMPTPYEYLLRGLDTAKGPKVNGARLDHRQI
jgi:hypothetical protein